MEGVDWYLRCAHPDVWEMFNAFSVAVRGCCAGMIQSMEHAGTCKPGIDEDGMIRGCDGRDDTPIRFCPWCGKRWL